MRFESLKVLLRTLMVPPQRIDPSFLKAFGGLRRAPRRYMMSDLLSARSQMRMSLAFHIIFGVIGVSLPLTMTIAEWLWLRTRELVNQLPAKRWAKGSAILFAIGAVSGTVLSFELGLLWPRFMEKAGSVIGMPFSLEGFAFFTEAIFLGIYLYGWDRVSGQTSDGDHRIKLDFKGTQ
jgi:cytochrome bd-type quinol oxidase subunit 1